MADLKNDKEFKELFVKLIENMQKDLSDHGYHLELEKVSFAPSADLTSCPCGTQAYIDRRTGQLKYRCRPCR